MLTRADAVPARPPPPTAVALAGRLARILVSTPSARRSDEPAATGGTMETTLIPTPSLEALVQRATEVATLPNVARRVLELLGQEQTSAAQLQAVIEKDQALTSRVLKIANSAFYGLRREVTSVQRAVVVLGFQTLRSLVVAASAKALHRRFGMTEQLLWEHAVFCSIAARVVARESGADRETVFLGGLLHDLGKIILNNETAEAYAAVMARTYNQGVLWNTAELEQYGFTHADAGAGVAEKWGFPAELVSIIAWHHRWQDEPGSHIPDPAVETAVAIVGLVDCLSRRHGIGYRKAADVDFHPLRVTATLGLDDDALERLGGECLAAYEAEKDAFQ
jgi:putative nucleotidyltransferase with HDIG domain